MKKQFASINRLLEFMKPFRKQIITAVLFAITGSAMGALFPLLISVVVDYIGANVEYVGERIVSTIDYDVIWQHSFRLIALLLTAQVLSYFANRMIATAIQRTMQSMRTILTDKLNRLPIAYFDKNQQGNILSRVTNDIDNIGGALQQGFLTLFTAVLTIILVFGILLTISWQVTLLISVLVPGTIIISRIIVKRSQSSFNNLQKALGELNGFIQEDYSGFEIIKLYGQETETEARFEELVQNVSRNGFRGNFLSSLINPLSGVIAYSVYLIIAVYGGYLTIQGAMTVGLLQACTQYVWQMSNPVSQIIELVPGIQGIMAASRRIFEVLDEPEESYDNETATLPAVVRGDVAFEHVAFSYSPTKPLITDLSFDVKAGQMVAIVGPTGAGKTTLVNLLMRFYDVNEGQILLDGIPTKSLSRADVRSQFGMVLQDSWLYQTTIRENIRFGKLDASDEAVEAAAKVANVHEFIMSLAHGYDTILNEETSNISGGQKQLLTIARAVLADPKILILDEATSSVDTRIELLIQSAMQRVMLNRTSFIIAHRLSTVRNADLILVMQNGAIVEQGTHEELLAQKGMYEELYNSQFVEE